MAGDPNYKTRMDALDLSVSIHRHLTPSGYPDAEMIVQDALTFEKFLLGRTDENVIVNTVNITPEQLVNEASEVFRIKHEEAF